MYLIHVRIRVPGGSTGPAGLAGIIGSFAEDRDRLEHVSVHRPLPGEVTVGFFSLAESLAEAEESAARVVGRAVSDHPDLAGFAVGPVGAALVPGPWWDPS
ncbi:hypothetical protein ACF9IK_17110 [Kitasatospora hibisci]|uniref:hypothetical protein n=1 Tax=Kitasatospora hibisci TaxID=3369522 RepID=UPI003753E945